MTQTNLVTHNLGLAHIGADLELKNAQEAYQRGDIEQQQLEQVGRKLRLAHWQLQADAGLDLITTGDFAWCDQVLTMSATLGNIPVRHRKSTDQNSTQVSVAQATAETPDNNIDLDTLFRVSHESTASGQLTGAPNRAQWFDTDTYYVAPEFHPKQTFALSWRQIITETAEAIAQGYAVKPVILGPLSYLWLGKEKDQDLQSTAAHQDYFDRLDLLDNLLPAYEQLLQALADLGVTWVQIDEPILVLNLPIKWQQAFERTYHRLQQKQLKLLLATYFGSLGENLSTAINLPVAGLHIDAAHAPEQLLNVVDRLSAHKVLSIGIVNGRLSDPNDLQKSLSVLQNAHERLGDRLWIAPSCSLWYSPIYLKCEFKRAIEVSSWLTFARQKIAEVVLLKQLLARPVDTLIHQALVQGSTALVEELRA